MKALVAERGQVTIPKPLRKRLGIGPRTVLNFEAEDGRLVAVKVTSEDPVSQVIGCLRMKQGTDEWIAELRGAS